MRRAVTHRPSPPPTSLPPTMPPSPGRRRTTRRQRRASSRRRTACRRRSWQPAWRRTLHMSAGTQAPAEAVARARWRSRAAAQNRTAARNLLAAQDPVSARNRMAAPHRRRRGCWTCDRWTNSTCATCPVSFLVIFVNLAGVWAFPQSSPLHTLLLLLDVQAAEFSMSHLHGGVLDVCSVCWESGGASSAGYQPACVGVRGATLRGPMGSYTLTVYSAPSLLLPNAVAPCMQGTAWPRKPGTLTSVSLTRFLQHPL